MKLSFLTDSLIYNEISNEYVEVSGDNSMTYNKLLGLLQSKVNFNKIKILRSTLVLNGMICKLAADAGNMLVFYVMWYSSNTLYFYRISVSKTTDTGLNTFIQCAFGTSSYMSITNLSLSNAGTSTFRLYYK